MCFLVMSPFSHDFMKIELTYQSIRNVLTYLSCIHFSHGAWFLDGTTSILVKGAFWKYL